MSAMRQTLDINICTYALRRRPAPMVERFADNVREFLRVPGLAVKEWDLNV